jgi:GntR family transcriptional regulator / MocR family aminotransferase
MALDEARWLRVERRPRETLRIAVERTVREAICAGALRPGVRLPSSRALAAQLGVSRGVTSEAYGQLAAQGFLITRPKAAPVVAEVGPPPRGTDPPAPQRRAPRFDLTPTTPDVTFFPTRRWTAALVAAARTVPTAAYDYGDPRGERALREVLADHLGRTRGVVAEPDRIVVVQGAAQGIDLITRVLAAGGAQQVVVEDPALESQPDRIRSNGLEPVGRPVDGDGLVVEEFGADAVLVTPAHQFPTGAVLSAARRRRLLEWARRNDALVIEDDYDAEFRYDREPVRAVQGLDPDHVAFLGTTSKTLAPALRLGWLVVPGRIADEAARVKHLLDVCSPAIDQHALAGFIARGEYDRQVRRARAIYRRRRDVLIGALERHLPDFAVEGVAAGMHVLVRLPGAVGDRVVASEAERDGVRVTPLSRFAVSRRAGCGLVIGYGRVHEDALEPAVAALADAVRRASQARAVRA